MNGERIMKTILFQGDSITDAGRAYHDINNLGFGYPLRVSGNIGFDEAGEYRFINKGISGNRIVDVYARIKADIINLKPDYMSLLIGVNDVWHEIDWQNGIDDAKFDKLYRMLLDEILVALPDLKIMLLEPFVLEGSATTANWNLFLEGTKAKAAIVKKIAEDYNVKFIPLQSLFDEVAKKTGNDYWLGDGVHPTPYGHELITREWIKAFNEIK